MSPLRGSFGSNGRSAGLVHTTARSASAATARIVVDVPSVIPTSVCFFPSSGKRVSFPAGTRYEDFPSFVQLFVVAHEEPRHLLDERLVVGAIPRFIEMELLVQRLLLECRAGIATRTRGGVCRWHRGGWSSATAPSRRDSCGTPDRVASVRFAPETRSWDRLSSPAARLSSAAGPVQERR